MEATSSFRSMVESIAEESSESDGVVERPDGLKYLSPTRARAFVGLLRAGDMLEARLNADLEARHGLSLRSFEVLLFLAVFAPEGRLRMSELSQAAPLSQSRVSRLVAQLERNGLVERSRADIDGRGVTVTITASGIERFKAAQETHLDGLNEWLFAHLSDTQIRQLSKITDKIVATLASDSKVGPG